MNKTIIVMTKVPLAGTVKTRLQPFLSAKQSATLAECFLLDTISKVELSENNLMIAYSPVEKLNALSAILPECENFFGQTGATLGERMFNAFEFAFRENSDAVVMIGTDSPTLPAEFIRQAFGELKRSDAVLGATADGGFYLIGLRKSRREIFERVAWSSPQTFEQTARNIEKLNLKLALLPVWYDVDTPEDFERLKKDLFENPKLAPRTFEFMRKFSA
ncbi:MAG: TIGR04282 family arsenosugar biosynthesis glycosyltransferase [Pyrinomonadaceae bacterium]